jgi:glycosyltransferase involved in cell wall biosynthesis
VKIHLYTILWNEEEMLPFFFRHYDPMVDRYVVYDDGSTDRTRAMLAAHPRVEVRPFVRSNSESFVLSCQSLHDEVWKESRGKADWVIMTDVDEHLYHPLGLGRYLWMMKRAGVTAVPALAFQMVADTFPSPREHLARTRRLGVPFDTYNKLSVFNPEAIVETCYGVGRHSAAPEGRVRYPRRDRLLLFHYKFLGLDYVLRRYTLLNGGLGPIDRQNCWGQQYLSHRSTLEAEFAALRRHAVKVTSAAARKLERQKWWGPSRPETPIGKRIWRFAARHRQLYRLYQRQ